MKPLLDIRDLTMYYETDSGYVRAVDQISFSVGRGECVGLAGESGCGKTSVALSILKLLPPNGRILQGEIALDGVGDLVKLGEEDMRRKVRWVRISMVFQGAMNALNPVMRIGDQISEPMIIHEGINKEEALERAQRLLGLVGIDPSRWKDYPHEFSGGMKQRAVIAMALACNPELLIADEPATGLDVIVQAQVMNALLELRRKLNLAMILITHDLALIAESCDRSYIMYAGRIVESSETRDIFAEPLHPYTRMLIKAFPNVRSASRELAHIPGVPPDLLNPPPGCRFHTRCPLADDRCKREEPPLREVERGRLVACHLA